MKDSNGAYVTCVQTHGYEPLVELLYNYYYDYYYYYDYCYYNYYYYYYYYYMTTITTVTTITGCSREGVTGRLYTVLKHRNCIMYA